MPQFKEYFVYILKCNDNTYYTGVTNDVDRRFSEHQNGYFPNAYTSNRRPVALVYYTRFSNVDIAIAMEKRLKKWSKKKKEALICGKLELLPDLSKKSFNR